MELTLLGSRSRTTVRMLISWPAASPSRSEQLQGNLDVSGRSEPRPRGFGWNVLSCELYGHFARSSRRATGAFRTTGPSLPMNRGNMREVAMLYGHLLASHSGVT